MRRLAVLAAALLAAGCMPADGTPAEPGDPEPPPTLAVPAVPADYWLIVNGRSPGGVDIERVLRCTIEGVSATGDVVELNGSPYTLVVTTSTLGEVDKSRRFPMYTQGAPALAFIKYECVMFGGEGEHIVCEAVSADGLRPAPLVNEQWTETIPRGMISARCYGVINALA